MAQCPTCGSEYPEGKRFCGDCGAALDLTSAPTETSLKSEPSPASHPTPDQARFIPGTVLAKRYRIVGLLGRGGMGEVYRADDLKLGQPVALKFLPQAVQRDQARLDRFLNEVKTALKVSHPNVCRVHDIGEVEGQHYLSMEYVDGEDLASLLRRIGRLPQDKAVQIARQLCAGLAAAHEQGILHRDLKPANVMIDGRGRAKITDFGLASLAAGIEGEEVRAGTPQYMSPEQHAGKEVNVRSDIYSLGLVLYELFTGKRAFEAASPPEIRKLQEESSPATPSTHVEGLDRAVERIILRCLEREPRDRPASALDIAAALPGGDPLAAALAAGETPSPEAVAAAGATDAMHPVLALGLALLALLGWAGAQYMRGAGQVRSVLPLDKPPAALAADAREIIRDLGYVEPLYAEPVDTAIGYERNFGTVRWIDENDTSPDRWDRLADPRLGVVSFWYRQRPEPLVPDLRGVWGTFWFHKGMVAIANPPVDVPGEIVVGLDLAGRLTSFLARPKRISLAGGDSVPDWSKPFALAGLDMTRFEPIEPSYDALIGSEERAAWEGTISGALRGKVRIEAGATAGRLVLFEILDEADVRRLSTEPEPRSGLGFRSMFMHTLTLVFLLLGAVFARRNLRMGRADRRGALRLAVFVFITASLFLVFESHRFWSRDMGIVWMPIVATGLFKAGLCWVWYLALEPHARRVWPTILTSWSRLVSAANVRVRDPRIGRAVLAGLVGGTAMVALRPVGFGLLEITTGTQFTPFIGDWSVVLGQRYILADVSYSAILALIRGVGLALALIAGRLLLRSRIAGALVVGAIVFPFVFAPQTTAAETLALAVLGFITAGICVLLLIRFGLLALVVSLLLVPAAYSSATTSWTAWHGQTGLTWLLIVGLLATYGFWAATAGRSLFGDALAETRRGP
jgi:serine/threonine-protein kinase